MVTNRPAPVGVDPDLLERYFWACDRLSPLDRMVVMLRYEQGCSLPQIAERMTMSSATAALTVLRRALITLQREMSDGRK